MVAQRKPDPFTPGVYDASDQSWRFKLWNYAYMASGGQWIPYAALRYISDQVQAAILRGDGRVIVNIPPRHGKSSLISHWLPTWFLDWYPHKEVILTSYGAKLSGKWGDKVREEVRSNALVNVSLGRKDTTAEWNTTHGGGMITAGVDGPVLGMGGDLVVIDDPYKNKAQAFSEDYRRSVEDWFDSTVYSRLEPGATIVVIMQRWHEDDFCNYLAKSHSDDWTQIVLPAVAEEGDPLGRPVGAALIPERYDEKAMARIKPAAGSLFWACMYQQRPSPMEGNIVLRDWIDYYLRYPPDIGKVVNSWDMSFKKTGKSWCVGQSWYQKGPEHWLLDQVRFKADFTTALREFVKFHNSTTERCAGCMRP